MISSASSALLLLALLALLAPAQAKLISTTVDIAALSTNGIEAATLQGASNMGQLGSTVSGAGDMNGDGFQDVVVSENGAAYVSFGKASGFGIVDSQYFVSGDSTGFVIKGDHVSTCSGAGDVNGDGFDDVLVGAPGADTTNGSRSEYGAPGKNT
jgi:hypothetical protein